MYRSESQFTHPKSFEYFATSRELYGKLTKDYQLPSICTLTRITSKFEMWLYNESHEERQAQLN